MLFAQSRACHVQLILVGEQHLPEVARVCGGAVRKGRPFLQHPALVRQLVGQSLHLVQEVTLGHTRTEESEYTTFRFRGVHKRLITLSVQRPEPRPHLLMNATPLIDQP